MEWIANPAIWAGLATLVVLEIVLGIDNLIFIAILAERLPAKARDRARMIGLSLALAMRLGLLASISWVMSLTEPLFRVGGHAVSWRDVILIAGGLFLLVKATTEIHERIEIKLPGQEPASASAGFWPVVAQIVVLDLVFSLDSVITAVGMVDELYVMMAAVIIAVAAMLVAAKPLTAFISARPSLIILCLGFLLMVGLVLVVDGLGVHVPKGYLYAAIGFSVLIESLNQLAMRSRRRLVASIPPRQRVADAILRLLGGVPLAPADALAAQAAGATVEMPKNVFTPLQRRMVRGVLELSHRRVRAIMTHRSHIAWLDENTSRDAILAQLQASPYREFPVGRGTIDEPIGVARKEDILAMCLKGEPFELADVLRQPAAVPASASVLDAFELFRRTPLELAIIVDEYGSFEGIVTRTDLLEAITGDLPEQPGEEPAVQPLPDGAFSIDAGLPLADLQEIFHIGELPDGDYHTAAGLVLALLGRMPHAGDTVSWAGWNFEVAGMDTLSITRLIARKAAPVSE